MRTPQSPGSDALLKLLSALSLGVLVSLVAHLPAAALDLRTGTGVPTLTGWCELHWYAGITSGPAALTDEGMVLLPGVQPPQSAYEISLARFAHGAMLIRLTSPSAVGDVSVWVDDERVDRFRVPAAGAWWIRITDLPSRGFLRLELDRYVEALTVNSILFPCEAGRVPVPVQSLNSASDRGPIQVSVCQHGLYFALGAAVAALVALVLWLGQT